MPSSQMLRVRSGIEHEQLPPLVEAVPEIRHAQPMPDRQMQYSRNYESVRGSSRFHEAHSLAPLSLANSRAQPSPSPHNLSSYGSQSLQRERSGYGTSSNQAGASTGYADYSIKRGNYLSTPPSSEQSRHGSPILLPAPRAYATSGSGFTDRDAHNDANMPPIYGNGNATHPHSTRPSTSSQQTPYDYYSQRRNSSPPRQLLHSAYSNIPNHNYAYPTGQYFDRSPFSGGGNGMYPLSFEAISDQGDRKQTRRRGNLPKAVIDILKFWFTEHIAHPYPTEEEKQTLMSQTGLTISQISNWFINARRRSLPQMTKQAQTETDIRDSQGAASKIRA